MKKWIISAICTSILATGGLAIAKNADPIKLLVNGKITTTDVAPQLINDRVLVPVRAVAEALGANVTWEQEKNQVVIEKIGPKPLASLPTNQTILYSLKEKDGLYDPLLLEHEGQYEIFNWTNVINPTYAPRILTKDLTGDGTKELIVILTTAYGTGTKIENLHILQNMKEIEVSDPIEIAKKRLQSKITTDYVEISIDGKTLSIPKHEIPVESTNIFKSIGIGSIVTYEIQENSIIAHLPVQISPAHFLGELVLSYQFVNNKFELTTIDFVKK